MPSVRTSNRIKRVAIIGPECTGKSELSEYLAGHFKTSWVKEYARTYLDSLNRAYVESDLSKIAQGQVEDEEDKAHKANAVLICDTNLVVIKIWSIIKFGRCSQEILDLHDAKSYDLTLLTYIDIPWEKDPLREHPEKRKQLWDVYKMELDQSREPYVEIRGDRDLRRKIAIQSISNMLNSNNG